MKKYLQNNDFGMDTMRTYITIAIFLFYTLPVVFKLMGEQGEAFITMQLVALNPIVLFVETIMYTVKTGINWKLPFIFAGLFIPTILIFFDWTAIAYSITYWVLSFIALAFGALIRRVLK